jgi:hypothetical protein
MSNKHYNEHFNKIKKGILKSYNSLPDPIYYSNDKIKIGIYKL